MKAKRMTSPSVRPISRRLREVIFILAVIVAVFLVLSFVSFHRSDPGWTSTGSHSISNLCGLAGAWVADIFLGVLGFSAYLFPVMLVYSSWHFCFRYSDEEFVWGQVGSRALGFLLLLLACSTLLAIHMVFLLRVLPYGAGGIIGYFLGKGLEAFFNDIGATLILIAFLLAGITLFSGMSWFGFFELIGRGFLKAIASLVHGMAMVWKKYRVARSARVSASSAESKQEPRWTESDVTVTAKSVKSVFRKVMARDDTPVRNEKAAREPIINAPIPRQLTPIKSFGQAVGLPSLDLLDMPKKMSERMVSKDLLTKMSHEVETHLADFGITAKVVAVHPGPVITRFEIDLAPGIKVSKIVGLAKDLARSLSVVSVRVVEVIPGKSVIGIEVPNEQREVVSLFDVLQSKEYQEKKSPLTIALGKDIAGHPFIVNLQKMPHLLVAGTTGSGKSVALNAMLLSLLYKVTPDEVRFIMIDPKMLELSIYEGIPHLLTPVVIDMKEAANALRWCVAEMDRRYRLMANFGVRHLFGFNEKIIEAKAKKEPLQDPFYKAPAGGKPLYLEPLPYIVVLIDEYADMMMVVGKKVEELIARIAQKARAAGIHLILATQRPSVDVITGLIKANIPTRIAFQVSQRIDSRTIIDQQGAEHLLGSGDMLYLPPGSGVPVRVHGAFVSDEEVHKVVKDWRSRGEPQYIEEITRDPSESAPEQDAETLDPLYDEAVMIVTETQRASISYVQRRLKIGYNRSARLLEEMEKQGVVSAIENNGLREVLAPPPPRESS